MTTQDELRALTESFVKQLAEVVRHAALESVQQALGQAGAASRRRPGRPRKAATSHEPQQSGRAKSARRAAGQKRPPEELAKTTEKLAAYITANPGQRIEQINKALGVQTKDLALPVKKLLKAKRISSKGQKRSTSYHPISKGLVQVKKGKKAAEAKPDGASA
jgi:ribosome-binding protein aMBF1 (putative translation factor)